MEATNHPYRIAHCDYINEQVKQTGEGAPTISLDTKKKELVGDSHNRRREYRPKGAPSRCGCTTSRSPNLAGRFPTAPTTAPAMAAG